MLRLTSGARVRRAIDLTRRRVRRHAAECSECRRELVDLSGAEERSVSTLLWARLGASDKAELERRVEAMPELYLPPLDPGDPSRRRPLLLSYGMWLGMPSVAEETGLPSVQPPEHIHAMARGPLAAAGGLYEADMTIDALRSVGVQTEDVRSALDFGCSSGRVVRVLAAAHPSVRWIGCDPNEQAISWAQENLAGIEFFANEQEPPLPIQSSSLDLVYGMSIWSHFAPTLGLRWLEEMRRLLRPGGHLVLTTHGLTSISLSASQGRRGTAQCREILQALFRRGWWYASEFGEQGDWGVVNESWGAAFLSPEWVLTNLCPPWRVLAFAPGRYQDNQDVWVFERV